MNKEQLRKLEGGNVTLLPSPKHLDHPSSAKPFDLWWVEQYTRGGLEIRFATGHGVRLPFDHIREWMEDGSGKTKGTLLLKAQLYLEGDRAWFRPLPPTGINYPNGA